MNWRDPLLEKPKTGQIVWVFVPGKEEICIEAVSINNCLDSRIELAVFVDLPTRDDIHGQYLNLECNSEFHVEPTSNWWNYITAWAPYEDMNVPKRTNVP